MDGDAFHHVKKKGLKLDLKLFVKYVVDFFHKYYCDQRSSYFLKLIINDAWKLIFNASF